LPLNAKRNTTSSITQNWNTTTNSYEPNTIGVYNITPSTNTCVFKCNTDTMYDKQSNACITKTKENQACI
jgi:hypothetical protein